MKALCPANSERVRNVLNVQNFVVLLILSWRLKSSKALVCAEQTAVFCFTLISLWVSGQIAINHSLQKLCVTRKSLTGAQNPFDKGLVKTDYHGSFSWSEVGWNPRDLTASRQVVSYNRRGRCENVTVDHVHLDTEWGLFENALEKCSFTLNLFRHFHFRTKNSILFYWGKKKQSIMNTWDFGGNDSKISPS